MSFGVREWGYFWIGVGWLSTIWTVYWLTYKFWGMALWLDNIFNSRGLEDKFIGKEDGPRSLGLVVRWAQEEDREIEKAETGYFGREVTNS